MASMDYFSKAVGKLSRKIFISYVMISSVEQSIYKQSTAHTSPLF
uniref:Uncharacterized protein n=1 Tax=Arundo donax TaxID=35708 RepID=A0A0A8Y7R7_ARUDO